jgi:hypothetical protein
MLRFGRIIACAEACGMSSQANGTLAAISTIAAQPAFIRRMVRSSNMGPRHCAAAGRRAKIVLRR